METEMGMTIQKDILVISFGAHIDWLGLTKDEALKFAEAIKQHANELPQDVTD